MDEYDYIDKTFKIMTMGDFEQFIQRSDVPDVFRHEHEELRDAYYALSDLRDKILDEGNK